VPTFYAAVGRLGAVYRDILASLAIGILMDAFAVRTLLVPATVALLGRWNWWPSAHGRRPALACAPAQVTRPSAAFTPES
jgi:RND superfamily putative drug exporter